MFLSVGSEPLDHADDVPRQLLGDDLEVVVDRDGDLGGGATRGRERLPGCAALQDPGTSPVRSCKQRFEEGLVGGELRGTRRRAAARMSDPPQAGPPAAAASAETSPAAGAAALQLGLGLLHGLSGLLQRLLRLGERLLGGGRGRRRHESDGRLRAIGR